MTSKKHEQHHDNHCSKDFSSSRLSSRRSQHDNAQKEVSAPNIHTASAAYLHGADAAAVAGIAVLGVALLQEGGLDGV
jgi:hypothetical protein